MLVQNFLIIAYDTRGYNKQKKQQNIIDQIV